MPTLSLSGLVTGIDTGALIQQLVAAESTQLNILRQRQSTWQTKSDAFGELQTHLTALQDAADELRDAKQLRTYNVASSDETVLTVSASSSASEGSHGVIINRLASAEREVHDGVVEKETLVGAGSFSYIYGTGGDAVTCTVDTTSETKLEDLRDLINNDADNPGVTASILEYDAGGDQVYHLVLSGNDSGSDNPISINDAGTTLDGSGVTVDFRSTTFIETQAALDSQVRVDGYPADPNWIERSTNTIDDVLVGVTLNLQATGTVNVILTRETESLEEKIQDMVEAYNAVVDFIAEKTTYDEETDTAGALIGEYTLTHVKRELRMTFVEALPGFEEGKNTFTLATQLGLELDRNGKLTLHTDEYVSESNTISYSGLNDALSEDYLAVLDLLGTRSTGASDSDYLKFYGATSYTEPGIYDVKATFDGGGNLTGAQIKLASESQYRDADIDAGNNLIIGLAGDDPDNPNPEFNLQVKATYNGSPTETAQVRVRQGLGAKLYDAIDQMLDTTPNLEGSIILAEDRCDSAVKRLQDYIEDQEERLEKLEENLTLKFARLERALTLLEAQRLALGMF